MLTHSSSQPTSRRALAVSVGLAVIASTTAVGCSFSRTIWETSGLFNATLTGGSTPGDVQGSVWRPEDSGNDDRVRMCDLRSVAWHVPHRQFVLGEVVAVVTDLPQALCRKGTWAVTGGHVVTWQPVAGHPDTAGAQRADGWSVTGMVTVTDYVDHDPGEPELNERLLSERVQGTFDVEAIGPGGTVIRLEQGTFGLDIHVSSYNSLAFD